MRLRLVPYFIRQAFQNVRENRLVHIVGISTMVISLLIFGTFLLLFYNLDTWIHGWGNTLSMSIYLEEGIDSGTEKKLVQLIRDLPGAKIDEMVSKKQAYNNLLRALGKDSVVLQGLPRNPLPASIEVVFKPLNGERPDPGPIKEKLEKLRGVEEVQYSEEWLNRFEGLMKVVRLAGFIIGGLLSLGVLFIVTNTIKLTIYSRQEEIEIMKLVGATDWFVKIPFLIEGSFQGVLSGLVSLLALYSGYAFLAAKKADILGLAILDFVFVPLPYVLTIFLVSAGLGLVGSFIALGRFFNL
ncbi:MAG: permease-like cell division protein FtsX [Desulfatiglandaceae bacterium]|jgi:cell division transport system permease protein